MIQSVWTNNFQGHECYICSYLIGTWNNEIHYMVYNNCLKKNYKITEQHCIPIISSNISKEIKVLNKTDHVFFPAKLVLSLKHKGFNMNPWQIGRVMHIKLICSKNNFVITLIGAKFIAGMN